MVRGVRRLVIRHNPGAARDLADYAAGTYAVPHGWGVQPVSRKMLVELWNTSEPGLVARLSRHFDKVLLRQQASGKSEIVDDCWRCFIDCQDGAALWELTMDAKVTGPGHKVSFGTPCEVRVPDITIGPRGQFSSIVRNRWCGERGEGYYSLIRTAESLEISDNPRAVEDLLAYA